MPRILGTEVLVCGICIVSELLFPLLKYWADFLHHFVNVSPTTESVVNGAVGIDEHKNGHTACIAWELAMESLKLLVRR